MKITVDKALDFVFKKISLIASLLIIFILIGIFITLVIKSQLAIDTFGLKFLYTAQWAPNFDKFGAVTSVIGTLIVSILAICIATPISIATSFFITYIVSKKYRTFFSVSTDLLSAIPSVIYGIIGLFYLAPLIGGIFHTSGLGIFTASLILAVMISPIIISSTRDAIESIPNILQESAYALGSTKIEVIIKIIIPEIKAIILNSIILATGRALGETMAITFIVGNANFLPNSILSPSNTITSTIANEFLEASSSLHQSSLIFLSLILFMISFITIILSNRITKSRYI